MATKQKFLRTDVNKYSKLGVRRKNKQVYRKAKGRDNKIRLKMKGHLRNVSIGFRSKKEGRELIKGLNPILVFNINDLKNIRKQEIGVVANIGDRKKTEIANYILKENVKLANFNAKKFLENVKKKIEKKKEDKKKKELKKIEQDKKAKKAAEKKAKEEAKQKKAEEKEKEKIEEKKEDKVEIKKEEIKPISKEDTSEKPLGVLDKGIKSNNYGRGN